MRVKKSWLGMMEMTEEDTAEVCSLEHTKVDELHCMHYMGVERTLFLVHKIDVDAIWKAHQKSGQRLQ